MICVLKTAIVASCFHLEVTEFFIALIHHEVLILSITKFLVICSYVIIMLSTVSVHLHSFEEVHSLGVET